MSFFRLEIDSSRIFGLDVLRAVAILCVIYQHAGNYLPQDLKQNYNVLVFDGVSIFFVLSGFLIGKILIQLYSRPNFKFKDLLVFWNRRWLRTLPNYFLILCILIVLNFIFNPNFSFGTVSNYFFFLQNFNSPHPNFFPEAWSLSIEEWFYVLIPIFIYGLTKFIKLNTKTSLLIIVLGIIVLTTLYRFYKFSNLEIISYGDWDLLFRKQVLTRLDSIMYGVLGSYFLYYHSKFWHKYDKLYFAFGILLFISPKLLNLLDLKPVTSLYNCVFSFSVFSLGVLLIIPYLTQLKRSKVWVSTLIIRTSLISYAMYITHLSLVQFWILDQIDWYQLSSNSSLVLIIKYLIFWVLTFFVAHVLYKYFERPIMDLRKPKTH